tara:strand:- start:9744 stop:11906 length:2163 start_codon:yes stop_codon:yes gene_type:complete
MKHLKLYEEHNLPNLPGIPREFPNDVDKTVDIIDFILDKFNIEVDKQHYWEIQYLGDLDMDSHTEWIYHLKREGILKSTLTLRKDNYCIDLIIHSEQSVSGFFLLETPYDLINYLIKIELINNDKLFKKINESNIDPDEMPYNKDECIEYIKSVLDAPKVKYNLIFGYNQLPVFELDDVEFSIIIENFVDENDGEFVYLVFIRDDNTLKREYYSSKKEFLYDLLLLYNIDMDKIAKKINEGNIVLKDIKEDNLLPNTREEVFKYITDTLDGFKVEYEKRLENSLNIPTFKHKPEMKIFIKDKDFKMDTDEVMSGVNGEDKSYFFIRYSTPMYSGFTYTKQGFLDALLKLYNIDMDKMAKKLNEASLIPDDKLNWNFTHFEQEDTVYSIEELLKGFRIKYRKRRLFDKIDPYGWKSIQNRGRPIRREHYATVFDFEYNNESVRVTVDFNKEYVNVFKIDDLPTIVENMNELKDAILSLAQNDVDKMFRKINESWGWNSMYFKRTNVTDPIKELLKKYKIPYNIRKIYDGESKYSHHIITFFEFNYKDKKIVISVNFREQIINFVEKGLRFGRVKIDDIGDLNDELLKLAQDDVDKAFKKINESSITDQDEEWKWNFTNFDPDDIEVYIEELLNKYRIPFRYQQISHDNREIHLFVFKYKGKSVTISVNHNGPIVKYALLTPTSNVESRSNSLILDNMEHLTKEILKLVQDDVNNAFKNINK